MAYAEFTEDFGGSFEEEPENGDWEIRYVNAPVLLDDGTVATGWLAERYENGNAHYRALTQDEYELHVTFDDYWIS